MKTTRFKDPKYVGDPINAIRIFNDKEVDELVLLDITASREGREPAYATIEEVAGECFMPLAYGGGIASVDQARRILRLGVEKVIFNRTAWTAPQVLRDASRAFGSHAGRMAEAGAGEFVRSSMDRDGTMKGYDTELIAKVSAAVGIPVIAAGGAGTIDHFRAAIQDGGCAAVAAGAMFVFHGPHRAVLITYPARAQLESVLP